VNKDFFTIELGTRDDDYIENYSLDKLEGFWKRVPYIKDREIFIMGLPKDLKELSEEVEKVFFEYKTLTNPLNTPIDWKQYAANFKLGSWAQLASCYFLKTQTPCNSVMTNFIVYPGKEGDPYDILAELNNDEQTEITFNTKNRTISSSTRKDLENGKLEVIFEIKYFKEKVCKFYITYFEKGLPVCLFVGWNTKEDLFKFEHYNEIQCRIKDMRYPRDLVDYLTKIAMDADQ
jgi:hypothetical protein